MTPTKLLDGRGEPWEGWVEQFMEVGWTRQQLPAGDFNFTTNDERMVGIECKSVDDLIGRMGDARRELAQLIDNVDIPILLVWGKWNRSSNDVLLGPRLPVTWKQLWNMIETFQDNNLRFQLATSRQHAFQRINQLFAYYQQPEHTSNLIARKAGGDRRVASLMAIPGVSKKIGTSLMKEFPSLKDVANAEISDLIKASLIGTGRASTIKNWFERTEPY